MSVQHPPTLANLDAASSESEKSTRYRAMVFDSEVLHGRLACRALERNGLECDVAYRPAEAIAKLEAGDYDLILIDVRYSRADQVKVAAAAFANRHQAKIMAMVAPGAGEVVKTLLSYGADEIVTDASDTEVLGVRALSLLEIEAWRLQSYFGHQVETENTPTDVLEEIERFLLPRSPKVLQRMGNPFEPAVMPSSLREAIGCCVERARLARVTASNGSSDRRQNERESVCLAASAVPLTDEGKACCVPFAVVIGDLSLTGARLGHTRPIAAKRIALHWHCASIADKSVTVEAEVIRCETVGRFYEIGARFV